MKTRLALLITMVLLAIGLPIPAHAASPFTYTVGNGEATITGYGGTVPTTLAIPDEITDDTGTYPVTAIGNYAFGGKKLTELTLPDSVTSIGTSAFNTNNITELTLSDNVTTIGNSAFNKNQIAELTLPSALTTLGNFAFAYNQLTDLTLPDRLAAIDYMAFVENPLATVLFTGAAPSLGVGALGMGTPTVRFSWKLGEPRTAGGYTTPTWHDYPTIPVADVTFVGGGDITAQSVDVDGSSTATKPADPAKAGHVFTGWFTEGAATPFDFTAPIVGDTVLTAGFAPAPPAPPVTPSNPDLSVTGLAPVITGDPREGKTLLAKPGSLSPSDAAVAYQWRADGTVIKGAAQGKLKLGKAQAGRRITVTITATAPGAPSVSKTSAKSKIVASSKPRLVLSTSTVAKGKPVTVTVTGFKARQKITIWLGGKKRYTGRADSRGVLTKSVTFAKGTKPGRIRVRVTGQQAGRDRTIQTTVRYR